MVKKILLPLILGFCTTTAFAQDDNEMKEQEYSAPKPLVIEGYGEVYYGYDFNQPTSNNRPDFVYSHNRHNEVNVNLAMLRAKYEKDRVRANIGIMAGTYANANMASEPGVLKNIYEANGGVRLHKFRELWLDAGVFESHIGPEGAISMDCPTLTRSLIAENSPYYEAGVRLSYRSINQKWYFALMHLNGWQRIQRVNGNSTPAGGMQITYTPTNKLTFNMSTFVGNDQPFGVVKMRYFTDFYAIMQLSKRWQVTAVADLGLQQTADGSSTYDDWTGFALITKYKVNRRSAWVARGEYFRDPYYVVAPNDAGSVGAGFFLWGYSLAYDRWVTKNVLWRVEGKGYAGKNPMFRRGGAWFNDDYVLTTSLAFRFNNRKNH
ncbi:MAG: porin [Chitinophagaceae bacterium]|nr:porin [Chitinophagaceae bacterium]MCB9046307.1 porin [Chitinophagales bacterium]